MEYHSKSYNSWVYLHGGFSSFEKATAWLEQQLLDYHSGNYKELD